MVSVARIFTSSYTTVILHAEQRGEHNYSVAAYNVDDSGMPEALYTGGIVAAREAWAELQMRLLADGFRPFSTVSGGEVGTLLQSIR